MAGSSFSKCMNRAFSILAVMLVFCLPQAGFAQGADVVTTVKDESGWRLQVNGKDFYVKGVVWGYSPRNKNYSYNLWAESDDFIRKVLDYEFGMMKKAGINANRSFTMIPPKWVTYIYREHGIMSVINPLMGRYGYTIGGKWVPFTDYSDPLTRETLLRDMLEIVEQYKDVPGVLMFAFGNESNYGLSWSSFEIENLPEGEQNTAKARYLYSLWNEVMAAGKKIAPNHPFSIVNGDIQYIDLIKEYCTDMDVLGVNAYRGPSFTDMWARVDEKLDLPIVFYEFGSDAFNARKMEEDQVAQAALLKDQWQEMYNKAAGNGEEGNSIGGFVFEWRDEWWKYLQVENLNIQDTNASWSNQAYLFDWAEGKNNMNEEWFGITALGTPNEDGVFEARPRMAYDVLAEIWKMDPYTWKRQAYNEAINNLDMDYYALKGEVRFLKSENKERKQKLHFTGGSFQGEFVFKGEEEDIDELGEFGDEFSDGQMVFLDFGFQPTNNVSGQMTLNILGNVADKEPLEIQYGRRGLPTVEVIERQAFPEEGGEGPEDRIIVTEDFQDRERVEIYDAEATYEGEWFNVNGFYHTPRYHWKDEGDFFGLIRETTDIAGQDIWNAKAPSGVEFEGKGGWEGLKILVGDEVYWGANPKIVLKYEWKWGKTELAFMHAEDVDRQGDAVGGAGQTEIETRQTTIYAKRDLADGVTLELGGLFASNEKEGDQFTRIDRDGNVYLDDIDLEDSFGFRTKLTFPLFGTTSYIATYHAGLVADGGSIRRDFGVMDPTRLPYSDYGNKEEYEAGMMINVGDFMIYPRVMYRDNLVHANPRIDPATSSGGIVNPGVSPRNRDNDPFAVLDNREARSAEVFVTYDPTGESFFYDWDNDYKEDARFAFNIGGNYTEYPTPTDSFQFFSPAFDQNLAFPNGLPAEDVWSVSSRMVFNPNTRAKYILNIERGFQQSTGEAEGGTRKFWELEGKIVLNNKHIIQGHAKFDAFGPYDFQRQFNLTFPEQFYLDYSMILDGSGDQPGETYGTSTQIGIRGIYRSLDENSETGYVEGVNEYLYQTVFYFTYMF